MYFMSRAWLLTLYALFQHEHGYSHACLAELKPFMLMVIGDVFVNGNWSCKQNY